MKTYTSINAGRAFKTAIALMALAGTAQMVKADMIPYSHVGTETTNPGTFSVSAAGDVWAYYTGSEASYSDLVGMSINGSTPSSFVFLNQPNVTPGITQIGAAIDLGSVTIGQIISFWLQVTPNGGSPYIIKSTTIGSIFSTPLGGGTYVGFEDLTANNDYDYNDETFVFGIQSVKTGNATTVVPEPTTIVAGALLLLPFGLSTVRILRSRKSSKS